MTEGKASGLPVGLIIFPGFSESLLKQRWAVVQVSVLVGQNRSSLLRQGTRGACLVLGGLAGTNKIMCHIWSQRTAQPLLYWGLGAFTHTQALGLNIVLIIGNSLILAQRQHFVRYVFILPSPSSMIFNFHHTLKQLTSKNTHN